MDYGLIVGLLEGQIAGKKTLDFGAQELNDFLKNNFSISLADKIDIKRLTNEFQENIKNIISKNKVPSNIKSIYFGLVTLSDNETQLTSIHITGSKFSPHEDPEWASSVDYQGGSYINLKDFSIIDSNLPDELDNKAAIEVVIFNGLLNLMIINSKDNIKSLTFKTGLFTKSRQTLWLGAGFDSGDCYSLGQIEL